MWHDHAAFKTWLRKEKTFSKTPKWHDMPDFHKKMRWYLCPWRPKISLLNHKRSPGSDFQLDITSPQVSAAHFVWRKSTDIDDNPRFLNLRVLKAMLTIFSDGRWKECDFLEHFGPPRFDLCLTVCPGISWIRHADCYHYKGSLLLYRNLFRSTISTTATNLS